ncbi:hypothetical protein F4813DRAFT_18352 [Daldinia decipiens]|uniref:uncharacterized protein n=1 Tax=Daldinia decipiens TaxID=326647 RepID=UPI0020C47B8B|nr:uncharacterized protein F4813DRAFT_18352 [Daldinia decipiens]KAI1663037.1 hypothetical protein F4813DRAFT_18352 [Daldinia decipiens]
MMPSLLGASMPHMPPQSYSSDPTFDELSRQFAFSDSIRRISRGSTGQRTPGAMRIVKPSSANSSPQAMMARRRTMMNDGNLAQRRQQALNQAVMQQMQQDCTSYSTPEIPIKRNNRPVSWHPTSYFQQPQMHIPMPQPDFSQYVMPAPMSYQQTDIYSGYQNLPPTPAIYSGQTSPISSMSPLCLPYAESSQTHPTPTYISNDVWNPTPQFMPNYTVNSSPGELEPFPSFDGQTSFNWDNTLSAHDFNSCTAPPTPDEFQPVQQPQPMVTPEESIPYQSLEEPEEEGEILVGMGLYDPPCKTDEDPSLDYYRTTTSQLLDTTYRGRGRGWKLEEAWEPPVSDDEEGDEDDEEDEGEKEQATE